MPNISVDSQASSSNALEKSYSFSFESSDNSGKSICGSNPIAIFNCLEDLDEFIETHTELRSLTNAGIAGYISYEGDLEFGVFEEIKVCETGLPRRLRYASSARNDDNLLVYPDPQKYINAVKKCQEYIREGDIYQANIAHKFIVRNTNLSEEEVYSKLKALNPAPYTGYMRFKNYSIISSSPESFLKISNTGTISSSPIKGTANLDQLNELSVSAKEHAEHIMIVDLIRNDLGRICETGSIALNEKLKIKKFINLYHLISVIEGQLKPEIYNINGVPSFAKIFASCFPGGSITGAPKIRAMQIIKELESNPRGPYTGTMGYYRFRDGGEFNILIRSIIINKIFDEISFHTGSGITAYSDPDSELEETYLKAEKLIEVFS